MFDSPLSASAYEVLQVTPEVDEETLRRAYRLRLRQTHPDTGGDAATFVLVQRAWELVGTVEARAAYDRGHGFAGASAPEWSSFAPPSRPADTRPGPRTSGHPGGRNRERFLVGIREWVGLGEPIADPYDPALVRSAPRHLKALLADALAEEATARVVADLGMGYTIWHDVAAGHRGDPGAKIDHVILGPSGLYSVTSLDAGGPVRVRRSELIGDGVDMPVGDLVAATRGLARAAGVRFGGGLIVMPDEDLPEPVLSIGKVRGLIVTATGQSTLTTLLRRGVDGVGDVGGNEIFDVRTRLNQTIRFA